MVLTHQTQFGIAILFLLAMLVAVKRVATGSILDKPKGNLMMQLVNVFNLFFLLLVNPLAAIALITGRLGTIDPTRVAVGLPRLLAAVEIAGLVLYLSGFALMALALIALGKNYQLGGCTPRPGDKLVARGPYRRIRNPMYTAALVISLGLACLLQSLAFFAVFAIYLVLILLLIPMEEDGMRKAYGESYAAYCLGTRKLIPFVY